MKQNREQRYKSLDLKLNPHVSKEPCYKPDYTGILHVLIEER